jgi:predicted DNA-binding protein
MKKPKPKVRVSFYLSPAMRSRLTAFCRRKGLSVSAFVRAKVESSLRGVR